MLHLKRTNLKRDVADRIDRIFVSFIAVSFSRWILLPNKGSPNLESTRFLFIVQLKSLIDASNFKDCEPIKIVTCTSAKAAEVLNVTKLSTLIFSDEHPPIGTAFDIHSGHLTDGTIEFLKFGGNCANLNPRVKQLRSLDMKLMNAKDKLVDFANSLDPNRAVSMENLLT